MKKFCILLKYKNAQQNKPQLDEQDFNDSLKILNDDISNQTQETHFQSNQQIVPQTKNQIKAQKENEVSQIVINHQCNQIESQIRDVVNQYELIKHPQQQQQLSFYSFQPFYNYDQLKTLKEQKDYEKLQQIIKTSQILNDQPVKKIKKNNSDYTIISQQKKMKNKNIQDYFSKIKTNQNSQIKATIQKDDDQAFTQRKKQQKKLLNQIQKFDSKIKVSNKPQIKKHADAIYGIAAINDDKILYHTKKSIIVCENLFDKKFVKLEKGCSSPIIGFQVNKAGQIIVQTETHVIFYSQELEILDSFTDKIEKDLLTFTLEIDYFDTLIYFSGKRNKLLMRKIQNSKNKFDKSSTLFETDKPISIQIIQSSNLFLGFQNGSIKQYSLNSNQIVNEFHFQHKNFNQMIFSSIIFRKQYCLGIIKNQILKLIYLSKETEIFVNATQNITQCSYYYNPKEKLYIIHALLINKKIYKSKLINGKQIEGKERSLNQKVTSITFSHRTSKFIYGCQNGVTKTYSIRKI